MVDIDMNQVGLVLVLVIVIEGIWLAGLSYLMWRRHHIEKKKKMEQAQQTQQEPLG